jgi:1-acyl-sn-glycerol-3-phosphate acyltransferase
MKNNILSILVSAWFWFTLFFVSAIFFMIALVLWVFTAPFDSKRRVLHAYTCYWSDFIFAINPLWKVTVTGRNRIDRKQAYVMVANHQSGADIMVLFKLHVHFKWVAKQGLFVIPFIGWNMYLNRYIPIERSVGRSKLQMMDHAADAIRQGNSVMIFPEGTRSRDGLVHQFKSGAFRLALETRSPILPVAVEGTFTAIKKGGFRIRKNKNIRVVVLEPISYETISTMSVKDIAFMVESAIKTELHQA